MCQLYHMKTYATWMQSCKYHSFFAVSHWYHDCCNLFSHWLKHSVLPHREKTNQIAKFMGPTWGPPGSYWPQMGPMLTPWTLLSGKPWFGLQNKYKLHKSRGLYKSQPLSTNAIFHNLLLLITFNSMISRMFISYKYNQSNEMANWKYWNMLRHVYSNDIKEYLVKLTNTLCYLKLFFVISHMVSSL